MNHGAFVYRNEGDGCITCKYFHDAEGPFAEACVLRPGEKFTDSFPGVYDSVWIDASGTRKDIVLTISLQKLNSKLFDLEWRDNLTNKLEFKGVAMLHDKNLVGSYWGV